MLNDMEKYQKAVEGSAVTARDRTQALLQIATAAAANYRREKQERGLLDYDDLIDKTLAMLGRVESAWVHYKLDRGIDMRSIAQTVHHNKSEQRAAHRA
jgi:ATP-dependent exoDNAse (exonuclease V) beta subunit